MLRTPCDKTFNMLYWHNYRSDQRVLLLGPTARFNAFLLKMSIMVLVMTWIYFHQRFFFLEISKRLNLTSTVESVVCMCVYHTLHWLAVEIMSFKVLFCLKSDLKSKMTPCRSADAPSANHNILRARAFLLWKISLDMDGFDLIC